MSKTLINNLCCPESGNTFSTSNIEWFYNYYSIGFTTVFYWRLYPSGIILLTLHIGIKLLCSTQLATVSVEGLYVYVYARLSNLGDPCADLGLLSFVPNNCFHIISSSFAASSIFFLSFHSCCSHAKVTGTTLLHGFHIFGSCTKLNTVTRI